MTRKRVALRLLLGTTVVLLLIELSVRIATHTVFSLGGPNSGRYAVVDPVAGRIPKAGISIHHPRGFNISIGEYGTRRNGNPPPPAARPPILAVGDSFAFGDQVDDRYSWPAILERRTATE